jgi:hypothetical protein
MSRYPDAAASRGGLAPADEGEELDEALELAWERLQEAHLSMDVLTHPGPNAELRLMEAMAAVDEYSELLNRAHSLVEPVF